jgi:hypothetical protein
MLFFHLIKDWPMLHAHDFLYIDVLQIKRQPTFVKKNLHNSPTEKIDAPSFTPYSHGSHNHR